jgi:PIN domain nuclease of toxin-antitoxin system
MLNLDTHLIVLALEGRLNPEERRLLANDFWSISDVVFWEIGFLARDRRVRTSPRDPELHRLLEGVTVWPVTLEIAHALRFLDFRSDPADEIIAATSIVHEIPLVTRDMRILRSRVVPLALGQR